MPKAIFVLCAVLLLAVESKTNLNSNVSSNRNPKPHSLASVKMISFNAWALPVWLPKTDQNNRYKKIPEVLLQSEADIICVQEAFARKFRKRLLPIMEQDYYTYSDYKCNQRIVGPIKKDCHGGLITFSKFPIIKEQFYPYPIYDEMRIEERIGEKGFLLTTIKIDQDTAYIINTHLYAGLNESDEKHRMVQIKHMHAILGDLGIMEEQIYLLGDLNVRHPDIARERHESFSQVYEYLSTTMGFMDTAPRLTLNDLTVNRDQNPYCGDKNGSQKLDYCLFKTPENRMVSINHYEVVFKGAASISDHMAWSASFNLSSNDYTVEDIAIDDQKTPTQSITVQQDVAVDPN